MGFNFNLETELYRHFGFRTFRPGQKDVIESLLSGYHTLAVMPTGGGKSLCYQLPAILMDGVAIVISPLIALMKDQLESLDRIGIPATFINSSISFEEINQRLNLIASGAFRLLFIAPERLESPLFNKQISNIRISFIAVDEAHCISEWGHDFRPSYTKIPASFPNYDHIPKIALTATATPEVRDDIIRSLDLSPAKRFVKGFDRSNLQYVTINSHDKKSVLLDIFRKEQSGSSIIYCGSRKRVEYFTNLLSGFGLNASMYHGGMNPADRNIQQEKFINGSSNIMVATNAFGMGIDKRDVRNVIHCDLPQSLEAYYQEAGRAGRDGNPSDCILIYHPADRRLQEFLLNLTYPELNVIESVYNSINDLAGNAIGQLANKPLYLDEIQIANRLNLPEKMVSSALGVLERNNIITRPGQSRFASIMILKEQDSILAYFESLNDNERLVLEAILRSISSEAFRKPVRVSVEDISRKFSIKTAQLIKFMELFEWNGIIKYIPEMTDTGINFLTERMHFSHLPIDFEKFIHRKEFAFNKLDIMQGYAETRACKRSFILNYFGENTGDDSCGNCSSCLSTNNMDKVVDSREQFIKNIILRAVAVYNEKFGRAFWIDYLAGAENDKIRDYGLEEDEYHASLKDVNKHDIARHIYELITDGYLELSNNKFPVLRLTRSAQLSVLATPAFLNRKSGGIPMNADLFEKLRKLRNSIAQRESILPSAIISDTAIRKIAAAEPDSLEKLIRIDSVGKTFADRYGRMFIKIILESKKPKAPDQVLKHEPGSEISGIISMISSGRMLSEIATEQRKSLPEIANLLEAEINSGLKLDPESLIEKTKYIQVSKLVRKNKRASLRQIRAAIDWEIEFPLLRILVAIARNTQE